MQASSQKQSLPAFGKHRAVTKIKIGESDSNAEKAVVQSSYGMQNTFSHSINIGIRTNAFKIPSSHGVIISKNKQVNF